MIIGGIIVALVITLGEGISVWNPATTVRDDPGPVAAVTSLIKASGRVQQWGLYAMLVQMGVPKETYKRMMDGLIDSGKVAREGEELVWKGER